jgi:hypothetical protein
MRSNLQRDRDSMLRFVIFICAWQVSFPVLADPPSIELNQERLQNLIDSARSNSIVHCDPNDHWILSAPVKIRKPLSLVGLHARLPARLGSTSLVIVEAPGVSVTD